MIATPQNTTQHPQPQKRKPHDDSEIAPGSARVDDVKLKRRRTEGAVGGGAQGGGVDVEQEVEELFEEVDAEAEAADDEWDVEAVGEATWGGGHDCMTWMGEGGWF